MYLVHIRYNDFKHVLFMYCISLSCVKIWHHVSTKCYLRIKTYMTLEDSVRIFFLYLFLADVEKNPDQCDPLNADNLTAGCYTISTHAISWWEAQEACYKKGGSLLSITFLDEQVCRVAGFYTVNLAYLIYSD